MLGANASPKPRTLTATAWFHLLRNGKRMESNGPPTNWENSISATCPKVLLSLQVDLPNLTIIGR